MSEPRISRQRTVPVTWRDQRLADAAGSVTGAGVHVGDDRHRRRVHRHAGQSASAMRVGGGLHQRAMERR